VVYATKAPLTWAGAGLPAGRCLTPVRVGPRGLPGQAAGLPSNSSGAPVLQQHRCPADL